MKANQKRLELAMTRACMNLPQVGEVANVPYQTMKNVWNGKNTKPATMGRIAKALGVDPADIIESEG